MQSTTTTKPAKTKASTHDAQFRSRHEGPTQYELSAQPSMVVGLASGHNNADAGRNISYCTCGGGCPQCQSNHATRLDRRYAISQPGDQQEREAEKTANEIVKYTAHGLAGAADESPISRSTTHFTEVQQTSTHPVPPVVHEVLHSTGQPLSAPSRNIMEQSFGRDFGAVRIHNNADAAKAAQAIKARAFTVNNNIVFNSGRYAPATLPGQRLLAHELTHVAQQADCGIAPNSMIQRDGEPGTSVYSERTTSSTTSSAEPGVWSGQVERTEHTESGRRIHRGRAPVRYDENTCTVTVPMTVSFRHANLSDVTRCPPSLSSPAPSILPAAVSESRLRTIAEQYISSLNEDLNGWYKVRLDDCETNACHGRDMPIRVEVTEASTGASADYEVAVANMSGRSCVSSHAYTQGGTGMVLLYASGLSTGTMAHEGGHMVLGHGDEYRETEAPSASRPIDRVRDDDYSLMGSHSRYGRFALMHERHFAFVPAYLNYVRTDCTAQLVEVDRPAPIDIGLSFGVGYAGFTTPGGSITSGLFIQAGLDFGIPLTRLRELELVMGPRFRLLHDNDVFRNAYLAGFRLGLEYTTTPSSGGFTAGAFGEVGAAWFQTEEFGDFHSGVYGEAGATLGYTFPATRLSIQAEGAYGRAVESVGTIGDRTLASDPASREFFRLGLIASVRF